MRLDVLGVLCVFKANCQGTLEVVTQAERVTKLMRSHIGNAFLEKKAVCLLLTVRLSIATAMGTCLQLLLDKPDLRVDLYAGTTSSTSSS